MQKKMLNTIWQQKLNKPELFFVLALFVSCLIASACSQSSDDNGWDALDGDTDSEISELGEAQENMLDGDFESAENLTLTPEQLSGHWAMKFAIDYTTVLPILQCKVQMLLTGIARINATMDGLVFSFTENICDLNMEIVEDMDFYVYFSEGSIAATETPARSAKFSAFEVGAKFETFPALSYYGIDTDKFDDPVNDPLPTELDDDRVTDFDNDGIPGLTATIDGFIKGKVFVIMRMMRDMEGVVVNSRKVVGDIDSAVEMITLGADPELLKFQLALELFDDPLLNHFEMVKLDSELSCAEIYEIEDTLFDYKPKEVATPLWIDECPREE